MKRIFLLGILLCCLSPLPAQTRREALLEYQARRRQAYNEFRSNYRKACADFLRKRWEAFDSQQPMPRPERREPVAPIVKDPEAGTVPTHDELPFDRIVDLPAISPDGGSAPATPAVRPEKRPDTSRSLRFSFYGTECSVNLTDKERIRLSSVQESAVAAAWERICAGGCDKAAAECMELKRQLKLNDWGYYELARAIAERACGEGTNESVLLRAFLMAEAGYKMRIARGDGRLLLLVAFDGKVYGRIYFRIDGQNFFLLDDGDRASSYAVCNFPIPGERALSPAMHEVPALTFRAGEPATREDKAAGIAATVTPNANLLDFMAGYPPCSWEIYAATALSERTAAQLFPVLRKATDGKTERQAAEILLHYLHRAFPYRTDEAQFGVERTLFAEELFGYPYSDCEDRSILYARLVKELLGLDVVLLYYPEHIATAVRFTEQTQGDYVQIGDERYVVCDPTYIGAGTGESMPQFKNTPARIIRMD